MLYGNILYHFQAGYFTLLSDNHYIRKILFGKHELGEDAVLAPEHPLLQEAARQLNEYFDGKLDPKSLGPYAGVAQQYIFHYIRNLENSD
jgi:O6-methylguanine-DNA--protein-cysteine methyltransferase